MTGLSISRRSRNGFVMAVSKTERLVKTRRLNLQSTLLDLQENWMSDTSAIAADTIFGEPDARRNAISLAAETIIANAPDPVFVSDLEGKILQANDAVSEVQGFRPEALVRLGLRRFFGPKETREFRGALGERVGRGGTRNGGLNPAAAGGGAIP